MSPKQDRADYGKYLQEKRRRMQVYFEADQARIKAKFELNIIDVEEEIRQFETAPPSPSYGRPTVEDLTRATKAVQNLESQLEALETMGQTPGIGDAMKPLIEGMLRPMLVTHLESAEQYRTHIQAALEETPEEIAANGTHD